MVDSFSADKSDKQVSSIELSWFEDEIVMINLVLSEVFTCVDELLKILHSTSCRVDAVYKKYH